MPLCNFLNTNAQFGIGEHGKGNSLIFTDTMFVSALTRRTAPPAQRERLDRGRSTVLISPGGGGVRPL